MATVVGFAGRAGSNRSTVAKTCSEMANVPMASFGDFCELATTMFLNTEDRSAQQLVGEALVKRPNDFAAALLRSVDYQPGGALIVDGVRHVEIVDALKRLVVPAEMNLVFVYASDELIEQELRKNAGEDEIALWKNHSTELQLLEELPKIANHTVNIGNGIPIDQICHEVLDRFKIAEVDANLQDVNWDRYHDLRSQQESRELTKEENSELEELDAFARRLDAKAWQRSKAAIQPALKLHEATLKSLDSLSEALEDLIKRREGN